MRPFETDLSMRKCWMRSLALPGWTCMLLVWLWLLASLVGAQTLSPELRERMERMGATQSELAEATKRRELLDDAEQTVPAELNQQVDRLTKEVAREQSSLTPQLFEELIEQAADLLDQQTGRLDDRAVQDRQRRGFPYFADNLRQYLKNGQFKLGEIHEGNASHQHGIIGSDSITVNTSLVEEALRSLARLDPKTQAYQDELYRRVASLASTLYHEKIHAHQYRFLKGLQMFEGAVTDRLRFEEEAHTHTIYALDEWLLINDRNARKHFGREDLQRVYLARALALLSIKREKIKTFLAEPFSKAYREEFSKLLKETEHLQSGYTALLKRNQEELSRGGYDGRIIFVAHSGAPAVPAPKGWGLFPDGSNSQQCFARMEAIEDRFVLPPMPWNEEANIQLVGRGLASGHIFDLKVNNASRSPIQFKLPVGLVLSSGNPSAQRMMVSAPVQVEVPPGGSQSYPVEGFCLDPNRSPPQGQSDGPWMPSTNERFPECKNIIEVGQRLAGNGQYHPSVFSAEKHRQTVIQRALWYERSRNTQEPWDESRLLSDLKEQVSRSNAAEKPDEATLEKVAKGIWEDVDLTLKIATPKK